MLSPGLKWTCTFFVVIILIVAAQFAYAQQPVVTSFSPLLGPPGTAVTITGTNFNTTPANNIVFFGATRANVSNATPIQLNVFVPLGASFDYVSVQNTANGLIGQSTVKYSPTRATGSGTITVGQFEPYKNFPDNLTGGGTRAVVNHDLDGDGKPDMVIVSDNSNSIAILRNTSVVGQLSFAPKTVYPTAEFPIHASVGDLNGDTKPDMVVVSRGNPDPASKTITVYRNTSTVGSISFTQVLVINTLVYALAPLADVDRDGKLDIIAPTGDVGVKILRNQSTLGNIVLSAPQEIVFPTSPMSGATITDLDGDGIPDMAAVNTGGTLYTLRNNSSPGVIVFETPVAHSGSFSSTFIIASGDLDQDGRTDLAVSDYNFGQSLNVLKNTSTVGNISFNSRVEFTMPDWYGYQTMMGDINADGKLDIVVSNERDEIVSVFENTTTPGVINASSFAARVDIPIAGTWDHFGASITDLDLDGRLDISVTTDQYVSVLRFDETYVPSFVTTWKTDVTGAGTITGTNQIRLPVNGGPYQVKWVEQGNPLNNGIVSGLNNAQIITFPTPGIYRVSISGSMNSIAFNSVGDRNKLLTVEHWGPTTWTSMEGAFAGCENMNVIALDAPDLSNVTSTSRMFADAHSFNAPVNHWDVSNVTNMQGMFYWATTFNQELYNWDVSNVTNMKQMFSSAESFDQYIDNWNTVSVTDMSETFSFAKVFNQSLNNWNVTNVTTMQDMFYFAGEFNQPLENWNVSSVTNMSRMFMLTKFNQPIGNWDVSNVTNMNQLFSYCHTFNQDLNAWDVSNVTDMSDMFIYANAFNSNIGSWDVSNVTNMSRMFHQNNVFDQDISAWDVGSVTNMSQMFMQAFSFNQNISGWDVSAVTNMSSMFESAGDFDQSLGSWNVSNVTNMTNIFNTPFTSVGLSRENYDNTLIGWAALSTLQPNVPVGAVNRYFCAAEGARSTLMTTHGWVFTGDFRFCPAPVITSFTPTSGLTGTVITITGTDFTGTTAVFFGTTPAASYTVVNATTITAIVGTGSSGALSVATAEGSDFSTDSFMFYGQPTIESFTPTSAGANATVTITGTYFTDATSVTFGGVPAKSYQIISETTITAAVGSGASGSVEVTAPGGTGSLSGFTFTAPANPPVIAGVQLSTSIEGMITLDLVPLITTSGSALDLSSLKVLTQPESGAQANIDAKGILTINYAGRRFSGTDAITIEACDMDGNCASQAFTIEVADNLIVYNGVSPGGANPEFIIEHIELLADTKKNTVTIFDRWQNEVWRGTNYDNTAVVFKGVSDSGKALPSGVYFYRIDFNSNRKRQAGFISIRR